jgi:signal transduction histidine kinase/CheY-like chemotaxis protein
LAVLASYVVLGGVVSLAGWIFDVQSLTDWDDDGISIQPNACLAVIAAGAALLLLDKGKHRAVGILGAFVTFVGGATLFQYVSGLDLSIDTPLMFERTWGRVGVVSPGRMGPPGATSWTLIGIAFVLASRARSSRARRLAPALSLVTTGISSLGLIGYLYGSSTLYSLPHSTVIALQTASFIFAVSIGLLLSVAEHGPLAILAAPTAGGMLARRALPAIIFVPILVGFLRVVGEQSGHFDSPFGSALRTLVEVALFLVLLVWAGAAVSKYAEQRARADEAALAHKEALEVELNDTRLLQGLSTELVLHEDSASFYDSILDAAFRLMRADFASMQMFYAERGASGELFLLAHRGFTDEAAAHWQWVPYDDGVTCCAEALRLGKRVIVEDVDLTVGVHGPADADTFRQVGIRGIQSTPLVSRSGVRLGIISTHWRAPHKPSERSLRLLDILARQAADWIERKQAESQKEALLHKEQQARADAERAARLKDEFLATLSHELRTPLNAVIGWAQILKRDLSDHERVRSAVEIIERNGREQARLITDLLDISRIVSGNMRLDLQAVDLAKVIEAAVESVLPAAAAKDVRIQTIIEPISRPIAGDPARLQQMVWNLLSNAVKFTSRGGQVGVTLASTASHAEIGVRDSGEGIAAEFLPHVFERFRQGDGSTSRQHSGLGLGLAIVKQFAELHGGAVRAASEGLGKGASFVIELPLTNGAEKETEPTPLATTRPFETATRHPALSLVGLHVLVVEDEPDAIAMVERILEAHGARVACARSSDLALGLLSREGFDVIVSDIGMPGRDGYELIREARGRGIRTPAIALTAFARDDDRKKSLAAGYDAHVEKPVDAHVLLDAVRKWGRLSGTGGELTDTQGAAS